MRIYRDGRVIGFWEAGAQALAAGCNGFLTKPIDIATFPKQVEAFLKGDAETLEQEEESLELKKYAQQLVTNLEDKILEQGGDIKLILRLLQERER